MYVVKTKALISCSVTAQLICAFVFAYSKNRLSQLASQIGSGELQLSVYNTLFLHMGLNYCVCTC